MVPPQRLQIDGIADTAKYLVSEHGGRDRFLAAALHPFRHREHRRNAVARMSRFAGAGIAVVEVEVPDHHAVGEGGELRARSLPADHDGGGTAARHFSRRLARDPGGLAIVAAERAADGVDDQALGLSDDLLREMFVTQPLGIGAQLLNQGTHALLHPKISRGKHATAQFAAGMLSIMRRNQIHGS
jgi:hypothetical protein